MQLLLKCARTRIDETTAASIRELAGGEIDWSGLRALAHRHRVMPLLYRSLYQTCPEIVPEDALATLRQDYHANAARNMYLKQELLKILGWFETAGIQAIPFKGPILAEQAYDDLALRQMDDLDILIQESDVLKARDLLLAQKFLPEFDDIVELGDHFLRHEGEYNFFEPVYCILLEIHWKFVPRGFIRGFSLEEEVLDQQSPSRHGSAGLPLSLEDNLLVVCTHGSRHAWAGLGAICDVAELLDNDSPISWDRLVKTARQHNVERMLYLGLELAKKFFDAQIPEGVFRQIEADPTTKRLVADVYNNFLLSEHEVLGAIQYSRFQLDLRRELLDRAGYLMNSLFRPSLNDWERVRFPHQLSFLYIILRPLRLLFGKFGR